MNRNLQQLTFSGIFENTFRLCLSSLKLYLKLFFLFLGVILLIVLISIGFVYWHTMDNQSFVQTLREMPYVMSNGSYLKNLVFMIPLIFVVVVLIVIFSSIFIYMSFDLFIKNYLGEYWELKSSFSRAKSKILKTIGSIFLMYLIMFVGFLLCCIGVFPAYIVVSLIMPILVYEDPNITGTLKKSYNLVKINFGDLLLLFLLLFLIVGSLSAVMQLLGLFFSGLLAVYSKSSSSVSTLFLIIISLIYGILIFAITILSSIFTNAFYVVLYFNQKVKIGDISDEVADSSNQH